MTSTSVVGRNSGAASSLIQSSTVPPPTKTSSSNRGPKRSIDSSSSGSRDSSGKTLVQLFGSDISFAHGANSDRIEEGEQFPQGLVLACRIGHPRVQGR